MEPHTARVYLSGDYDSANSDDLRQQLLDQRGSATHVELDMSAVTYFGSAGLSAILDLYHQLISSGGNLVITQASTMVHTVLALTGLDQHLLQHPGPNTGHETD